MKLDELTKKYLLPDLLETIIADLRFTGKQNMSNTMVVKASVLAGNEKILLIESAGAQYIINRIDVLNVDLDDSVRRAVADESIGVKLTLLKESKIIRLVEVSGDTIVSVQKKPTVIAVDSQAKQYSVPETKIQARDSGRTQNLAQTGLANLASNKPADDQREYNYSTSYDSKENTSYQTAHDTNTSDMGKPVVTTDYAQETSIDVTTDYNPDVKLAGPNARNFNTSYNTKGATMIATSVETKASKFGISEVATDSLEDPGVDLNTDFAADVEDG